MENLGFSEFLGILLFVFPFLVYITAVLFDGIGIFRDKFHFTARGR